MAVQMAGYLYIRPSNCLFQSVCQSIYIFAEARLTHIKYCLPFFLHTLIGFNMNSFFFQTNINFFCSFIAFLVINVRAKNMFNVYRDVCMNG